METLGMGTGPSLEEKMGRRRMPETRRSQRTNRETKKIMPQKIQEIKWGSSALDEEIIKKAELLDQLRAQLATEYPETKTIQAIKPEHSAYDEARMTPGEKERIQKEIEEEENKPKGWINKFFN